MRHQYTAVFKDTLTSRVWASSPATRAVWLWLRLSADPEGFVPSDLAGVALGANVSLPEAREAIDFLESVDVDADPEDFEQGRIIERVTRGWRVLNFEEDRERCKLEAAKARNRRYMRRVRAKGREERAELEGVDAAVDAMVASVASEPLEVDQPKPTPKPKYIPSEGDDSPNPRPDLEWTPTPTVLHSIPDDWVPSESLRQAATVAGVQRFDEHVARLRTGPVGGNRGVFAHELETYVRSMLGKWRMWEETDRAKAAKAATTPSRFDGPPPPPPRAHVEGFPEWVHPEHQAAAQSHGLDLKRAAMAYGRQAHIRPSTLRPIDVFEPFMAFLANLAREVA